VTATARPHLGSVAVLGGGVSGISTALLLQLSGISTVLYAQARPTDYPAQMPAAPEFATLHAAASVIPHSVQSSRIRPWVDASREFFRMLAFRADTGVRLQSHYELFETSPIMKPSYAPSMDNFEMVDDRELSHSRLPRRLTAATVAGWRFDAYFCEAPTYVRYLYSLYTAIGGRVLSTNKLGLDGHLISYLRLGHAIFVNCTGIGTFQLLDPKHLDEVEDSPDDTLLFEPLLDTSEPRIERGHYIKVARPAPLVDHHGHFLSYNYTPTPDIYEAYDSLSADVYCYPRSDAWILGGSRQLQRCHGATETWLGDPTPQGMETFQQAHGAVISVPRPIFELNAELIAQITGGAVSLHRLRQDTPSVFSAGIGYRFRRSDPQESVRLACSRVRFASAQYAVVHNYGHGGAGFTLSWGCALDALRVVQRLIEEGWPFPSPSESEHPEAVRIPATMLAGILTRLDEEEPKGPVK
jgi:D-amino-acid oxidase